MQGLGAAPHVGGQVDLLRLDAFAEPVDVAAGAEGLAGAGDDQRPQRRPVGEPGEGDGHLADHLRAHRVEGVGAVEGEGADLPVDLDPQRVQLAAGSGSRSSSLSPRLGVRFGRVASSLPLERWPKAGGTSETARRGAERIAAAAPQRCPTRPASTSSTTRDGRAALRRQGALDPQAGRLPLLRRRAPGSPRASTASSSSSPPTRRRRCWPSRASSSATGRASTSACATTSPTPTSRVSLDEDYPRVYFTREKHRAGRAYFGPFSSAKRVRETLDLLGKLFQFRTCEGAEPGRRSGSPCLDYYIKRCGAPCVGYVSREEYRRNIDAIVDFLSGRYRQVEREEEAKMEAAAAARGIRARRAAPRPAARRSARCSSASGSPAARSAPPT